MRASLVEAVGVCLVVTASVVLTLAGASVSAALGMLVAGLFLFGFGVVLVYVAAADTGGGKR